MKKLIVLIMLGLLLVSCAPADPATASDNEQLKVISTQLEEINLQLAKMLDEPAGDPAEVPAGVPVELITMKYVGGIVALEQYSRKLVELPYGMQCFLQEGFEQKSFGSQYDSVAYGPTDVSWLICDGQGYYVDMSEYK